MEADTMTFEQLKEKAHSLPLEPGVYLMQDQSNTVIYVGKAKKLRNRVSQYFQDSASHTAKTRRMVSQIDHFDVIVARTEFEALVLECSLIKRHMPKYNILLKDDKGYPYLRIDRREEYPVMEIVSRVTGDGADYFGPFGGRSVTSQLMDTLRLTFHLPGCSKVFPRDLGKERPCLNYHMNNCDGWCQLGKSPQEYRARMDQVVLLLKGSTRLWPMTCAGRWRKRRRRWSLSGRRFCATGFWPLRISARSSWSRRAPWRIPMSSATARIRPRAASRCSTTWSAASSIRTMKLSRRRTAWRRPSPPWSSSIISPATVCPRRSCSRWRWRTPSSLPSSSRDLPKARAYPCAPAGGRGAAGVSGQ